MYKNWLGAGVLLLGIAAAGISGCATTSSGSVVALPNGYAIVHGKQGEPTIVKSGGSVVVPGPVATYRVIRQVVTGQVGVRPPAAAQGLPQTAPLHGGYFVLDTHTGTIEAGLSMAQWNQQLKTLKIAASPELDAPIMP